MDQSINCIRRNSWQDLEDDIEDKIEDAFDELDHIVVLVEDKIIYLNFSGSSYDYVAEGSGSYERQEQNNIDFCSFF